MTPRRALEHAGRSDLPWADRLALPARADVRGACRCSSCSTTSRTTSTATRTAPASGRPSARRAARARSSREPGTLAAARHEPYAFALPDGAERALDVQPLGPLSAAETRKLVWSLPALDRLLDDDEVERVWRMVGGHPRSLEYLDALLSRGGGRYPDIDDRLGRALCAAARRREAAASC